MRTLFLLASVTLATPALAGSPLIERLEGQLASLGYQVGAVDGRYDAALRTAVEQFQGDQGMAVTGNLDSTTRERLNQVAPPQTAGSSETAPESASTPAPAPTATTAPTSDTAAAPAPAPESTPARHGTRSSDSNGGIVFGKRFGGVVGGAIEFGGDDIGRVFFTDGSSQDLTAGDGVSLEIGVFGRPSPAPFALRGTIGFKYTTTQAENADINVNRLVLNVIGTHEIGQFRVGGGITHHSNISFDTDGLGGDQDFDDALGLTLEIGWSWLVLSYTSIDYEPEGTNREVDASNIGLRTLFSF